MSLAMRLKKLRANNKVSLQTVADDIGVSKAHIWELETGKSANPSVELIKKLADHFNVSVALLLDETSDDATLEETAFLRSYKELSPRSRELLRNLAKDLKKVEG